MDRMVFCAFDGTITVEETFVAMLKRFAPQPATQVLPEICSQIRIWVQQSPRHLNTSGGNIQITT